MVPLIFSVKNCQISIAEHKWEQSTAISIARRLPERQFAENLGC